MIKVSLFPMAPSVSSRATLLVSFVCFQRYLSLPKCPGSIINQVIFPQVCRRSTALYFSFTDIPICFSFLFFFPLSTTSQGGANVGGGSAILWSSSLAESPQVPLLTWGDLINALNHPLLIFTGPRWQG